MAYYLADEMKEMGREIERRIAELENENRDLKKRVEALEKK